MGPKNDKKWVVESCDDKKILWLKNKNYDWKKVRNLKDFIIEKYNCFIWVFTCF